MDRTDLPQMENELLELFGTRLGVKASSLETGLRKAGRRLPARHRKGGQTIVEALKKSEHPQLAAQLDHKRIDKVHGALKLHLEGIDRREQRIRSALRVTSGLAFNLLVLAAAVIIVLRLRGFV